MFWGPSMTLGWVISHAFGQKYGEKAIFRKKFFIFCKTYPKKLGRFWNFGIFHSTFSKCYKIIDIIAGIDSSIPNKGSLRPRFLNFSVFPHFFDKNFQNFQNLPEKLGRLWKKWNFLVKKSGFRRNIDAVLIGFHFLVS